LRIGVRGAAMIERPAKFWILDRQDGEGLNLLPSRRIFFDWQGTSEASSGV